MKVVATTSDAEVQTGGGGTLGETREGLGRREVAVRKALAAANLMAAAAWRGGDSSGDGARSEAAASGSARLGVEGAVRWR
uniref:Uncharacterized protein K0253H11.13 n=1 Tax=Oryza sativa subsp. indica TaxID=39946 RepID=C8TFK6_ORYSI|nr:hypothetical protein [Oryza sativa Indica Group]